MMNWAYIITLILLLTLNTGCSHSGRSLASRDAVKHVVFDIDWTIVSEISPENTEALFDSRVINVQGKYYFVHEGLEEIMEEIKKYPDVKISFYSGGPASRNHELLSKIKMNNGKSLKDLAFKILSFEDLRPIRDISPDEKFSKRFKKDLTKISENLDELIMFDDTPHFVYEGLYPQSDHVFFIGTSFSHFRKFKDAIGQSGEYVPLSQEAWLLNRKKLFILNEIFKLAYAEAMESNKGFSAIFKKYESMANFDRHEWNDFTVKLYNQHLIPSKNQVAPNTCMDLAQSFF